MLELDGSFGEGGGQILRTSLTLSLLTGKAFHLAHIRARRNKPGLQAQHLACVRAAAAIGQAEVRGASLHSTDLTFEPGEVTAGKYHFAIGTAGATSLLLHALYLPLALRGTQASELTLQGGTHVTTSPCFHFLDVTWRGYLELLGVAVRLRLQHPGFYPRGGGLIVATIEPCPRVKAGCLEVETTRSATGFSAVAKLPTHIAERQARRACQRLRDRGIKAHLDEETWPGGPGTVLAVTLNSKPVPTLFFALGAQGKAAEKVADEAVDQAVAFHRAKTPGIDPHSADQLVLPLALAEGASHFTVTEVTQHLLTNIAVIRQFVDRSIGCQGDEGQPGVVRIE